MEFRLKAEDTKGLVMRLEPRDARRQLEQQSQELPIGEPQQQLAGQPEQQQRVPACLPPAQQLSARLLTQTESCLCVFTGAKRVFQTRGW